MEKTNHFENSAAVALALAAQARQQTAAAAAVPSNLSHGAPDFSTLHVSNVASTGEIQPVGFIQLGPNQEVEISNALILSHQCSCQAQLAVRLHNANYLHPTAATSATHRQVRTNIH